MDANLTSSERNLVQTAVQGSFGNVRIAQELRTQWPEEDLKDHDQGLNQSSYWQDDTAAECSPRAEQWKNAELKVRLMELGLGSTTTHLIPRHRADDLGDSTQPCHEEEGGHAGVYFGLGADHHRAGDYDGPAETCHAWRRSMSLPSRTVRIPWGSPIMPAEPMPR